jgi:hypothetical protein
MKIVSVSFLQEKTRSKKEIKNKIYKPDAELFSFVRESFYHKQKYFCNIFDVSVFVQYSPNM